MDHLCPLQRNHCYMRWTRMRWIICVLSSGITVTWDGPGWDGSSVSSPAESLLHEMDQDEMDHLCPLQLNHCYMRWIICVLSSWITVTWDGSSVSSPAESLLHKMDHLCPLQRNHCYMRWIICVLSSGITVTWDGPGFWDNWTQCISSFFVFLLFFVVFFDCSTLDFFPLSFPFYCLSLVFTDLFIFSAS